MTRYDVTVFNTQSYNDMFYPVACCMTTQIDPTI